MYKITYTSDGKGETQSSRVIRGKLYGEVYLSQAAAEHVAEKIPWGEPDEDGGFSGMLPIDCRVEEITPHDFATRRQCIVILCRQCGGNINDDMLPFPVSSDLDLARLTWEWIIESDDFTHDAGCESAIIWAVLKNKPIPPDAPILDPKNWS